MTNVEVERRFGGTCQADQCALRPWVKGYCKAHYSQFRRTGRTRPLRATVALNDECGFSGCTRSQHARGYCSGHYAQLRRGAPLTPIDAKKPERICAFPECNRDIRSNGLCNAHYSQTFRGEELRPIRDYFTPVRRCEIPGCEEGADLRGLCKTHRRRAEKYGLTNAKLAEVLGPGRCEICNKLLVTQLDAHIDHDHTCCPSGSSCGECVRGLLCSDCNLSLGKMNDDPQRLRAAADYLERSR